MYRQFASSASAARINLASAGRALGWLALLATTLLLAFVLETLVAGAQSAERTRESPTSCARLSPSTAALADGDDIQARLLARLAAEDRPGSSGPMKEKSWC